MVENLGANPIKRQTMEGIGIVQPGNESVEANRRDLETPKRDILGMKN